MLFNKNTTLLMTLAAFCGPVRGFMTRSVPVAGRLATARFSTDDKSSVPMPLEESKMPFYALGVNLALQVGGQGNMKTLLDEQELDYVLQGFCENLKGTAAVEPRDVLQSYGQTLNQILQERSSQIVDRVKKEGADFLQNFLECNEEATQTESGLVYYEMTPGTGAQPTMQSTVEVHYQ